MQVLALVGLVRRCYSKGMHSVAFNRWSLVGLFLSLGCSGESSPVSRGRSPVVGSTTDGVTELASEGSTSDDGTFGGSQPSGESTREGDTSGVEPVRTTGGQQWVLVREEDPDVPFVQEWEYDDMARLVHARILGFRRDVQPYYVTDVSITYGRDRVTSLYDHQPEDLLDLEREYQLESRRVVSFTESAAGEVHDGRTYEYDSDGLLMGSRETHSGEDEVWRLERRVDGEPWRLFQNDELVCDYEWRTRWLGTKCYTNGAVSQTYEADQNERLARLSYDGVTPSEYSYDDAGRLTEIRHGDAVFEYRYSIDGRLLESKGPDFEELREYDDVGLLREVRWRDDYHTSTTFFSHERLSAHEVVQTETRDQKRIVRTYHRLPQPPTQEPVLPSYWSILRTDQPNVYMAPLDFSNVP